MDAGNAQPSTSSNSQAKQDPKYVLQYVWEELPSEYRLLTFEEVLENAEEITDFLVYHHPEKFEYAEGMMGSTSEAEITNASCKFLLYIDYNSAGIYTVDGYSCKADVKFENGLNGITFVPKPGGLNVQLTNKVELWDDDYRSTRGGLLRSSIDAEIPEGYRLASVEELKSSYTYNMKFIVVVKKSELQVDGKSEDLWLILRKMGHLQQGEDRDIQDVSRDSYFLYASQPEYEPRIRLKNGFIDMNRRLVWKEFSKHNIAYILGVHCTHTSMEHKTELKDEDKVVALLFSCVLDSSGEIEELKKDKNFLKIMTQNNRNAPSRGSAIHLCAQEGLCDRLEQMFAKLSKDNINEACNAKAAMDDETPLHVAVLNDKKKMVQRLCTKDSINAKTKRKGWTPLMRVAEYQGQKSELWKTLLACKGLNLGIENKVKSTVFHSLASGGSRPHASMLKEMLEKCGCKVSYEAYQAAVLAGQLQPTDVCVRMSIEEVAKLHDDNFRHTRLPRNESSVINHPNMRGETPLHAFLNIRPILPPTSTAAGDVDDSDDDDANIPSQPSQYEFTVPIQFSALLISAGTDIKAVDKQGQNALHKVCLLPGDMVQMCQILHACFLAKYSQWHEYVCSQSFYGENVLHIAAKSGNVGIVNFLLNPKTSDKNTVYELIKMRDYDDKTIFHSLASSPQKFTVEDKEKLEIAKLIWKKAEQICKGGSKGELQLIIWSVDEDGKLADKLAADNKYPELAHYLEDKRENSKENLLGLALNFDNFDMALELINRDAVITKKMREHAEIVELKIEDWKSRGLPPLNKINELETIKLSHRGRTTDQPTDEDLLDRADIKNSISALLLNQQMGSPITLGILGGTGMGKSSMMLQVEHNLLSRAATETLRFALPKNKGDSISEPSFTGKKVQSSQLERRSKQILTELQHVIREIEYNKKDDEFDNEAIDLEKSNDPHSKWHSLLENLSKPFKRIKSMIVSTFECEDLPEEKMKEKIDSYITNFKEDNKWVAKRLALVSHGEEVHALMTVRIDAWQYEKKDEAWAGMAIEIIKEIENSMTKAQLLYASLMYSKKRNESYARMNWMIVAYLVVGGIAAFIFYTLFALVKSRYGKTFQFGSVVLSFLGATWGVLRRITQYAKPISDTLMERTKSMQMEHLSKVGYQHQVIEDINFLKSLMTYRDIPMLPLFKLLAYILNIQSRSTFLASPVEASDALKHIPRYKHHFRIIMFIDNLDRDKEELFTPINMILKSCDINAVVAIDTKAVDEVSARKQEQNVAVDQVADERIKKDTLLTQLIQIPIVLPEPDVHELNNIFLKKHLKDMPKEKKTAKKKPDSSPQSGGQNQSAVDKHNAKITSSDIIMETKGNGPSLHKVTRLSVEISPTIDLLPMEYTMTKNGQSSQEISIETEEHPSHSIQRFPTNDNLPREHEMVMRKSIHRAQPDQEISIKTEEHPSHSIQRSPTNDNLPREHEMVMRKSIHRAQRDQVRREIKIDVLDSNYSRGEIDIFERISKHTSGYYRSPRAWKSLLNYHRLIRSLLTYDIHNFKGKAWKRQLVIWLFFCWQWKKQMDEIFQRWEELTYYTLADIEEDSFITERDHRRELKKVLMADYPLNLLKKKRNIFLWESVNNIYPTLSMIVSDMENRSARNPEGSTQNENMKEGSTQNPQGSTVADQNENMNETSSQIWKRLSNALTHGDIDVSMQCMLVFQKYRFDCKPGVLNLCHRRK